MSLWWLSACCDPFFASLQARIKARPLVRTGGSTPFVGNKAPNQQQSEATVPYIRPQQTQYQMLPAPMSQFVNQQQVPPAVTVSLFAFVCVCVEWR